MSEQRQSAGRASEHDYRSKGAPRVPRLPEQRQKPFTWAAIIWIAFFAVAGWIIYSRF